MGLGLRDGLVSTSELVFSDLLVYGVFSWHFVHFIHLCSRPLLYISHPPSLSLIGLLHPWHLFSVFSISLHLLQCIFSYGPVYDFLIFDF